MIAVVRISISMKPEDLAEIKKVAEKNGRNVSRQMLHSFHQHRKIVERKEKKGRNCE